MGFDVGFNRFIGSSRRDRAPAAGMPRSTLGSTRGSWSLRSISTSPSASDRVTRLFEPRVYRVLVFGELVFVLFLSSWFSLR